MISNGVTKEDLSDFLLTNQDKLYRFAYSYVKNTDMAMDVVQEAAIKALTSYKSIREANFLKTWFYKILINTALTSLKKNKKYVLTDDFQIYDKGGYNESIENIGNIDLYEAVCKLPEKYKTVIILRFFEDMKFSDIAKILDSPESTIKTRIKSALNQLNQYMKEEGK